MIRSKLFAYATLFTFAVGSAGLAAAQEDTSAQDTSSAHVNRAPLPEVQQAPSPVQLPQGIVKPKGTIITPAISVSAPGRAVHTNFKIFVPAGHGISSAVPDATFAETPASMGCVYGVGPSYTGCVPGAGGTDHPTGGWGAVAVVDAYYDKTIISDLEYFDSYFGVPTANFARINANSSYGTLGGLTASCSGQPPSAATNFQWDIEESLDVEWAHVMAPKAKIILVQACSQSLPDLLYAEQVAGIEVSKYGGGDISNSWGYPESEVGVSGDGGGTLTEQDDDNFFYRYYYSNITYFASAGDSGSEVIYPSASPWVVSVGGTTVNRDSNGNFLNESCWSDSGGGPSTVETWANPPDIFTGLGPWTDYQDGLFGGGPYDSPYRSTPDISFNADPNSGVWVYDTDEGGGWYVVGGTSVSAPAIAGIVNAANNRLGMVGPGDYYTPTELNLLYSQLPTHTFSSHFYDVTTGSNGHAAAAGYDQCTGIGSPRGYTGK